MKNLIFLFLLPFAMTTYAQTADGINAALVGKWNVVTKNEMKKTNGKVTEQKKKAYHTNEKTYEFLKDNTLIVTDDYGAEKENLPARTSGKSLFIGKDHTNKIPYTYTLSGNVLRLVKVETKNKKGRTVVETEQVNLTRKK